jgi:putative transposase
VSAVADAVGMSRPHLSAMRRPGEQRHRGRPPLPDTELVADIRRLIADLPTYGYRRVHALLRREAEGNERAAPNPKRVYRVMKLHGLLLQRHSGRGEERRHDGKIAVQIRNTRWCSDGLEIGCDNGEKVRVAFALDCCDREAMGYVATTGGITAEDVRGHRQVGRPSAWRVPGGQISVLHDDTPRSSLCWLSPSRRDNQLCGLAVFPLPIELAHG